MTVTAHRAPHVILRIAVALIAVAALMTPASRASAFTFTTIDVPGAVETVARAITNDGDIAGHFKDANGQQHGFLLVGGVFTTIDFPGADQTRARGINKSDSIVG
jgi:probable HAF family extracellular repeat protein